MAANGDPPATNDATARVLFREGRKLATDGDYRAACAKFEESYRLDPGVGTNFNLADCLEHLGKTASAWVRFLDVAAATKSAGQTERLQVARARADALLPQLSRLSITVTRAADAITVERDSNIVMPEAWDVPVAVDPGEHLVEAFAPGKRGWSSRVIVPAGGATVTVVIPALMDAGVSRSGGAAALAAWAAVPASDSAAPQPPSTRPGSRTAAVGLAAAVGTLALGTAAIFAVKFRSENNAAKMLCPADICDDEQEKDRYASHVAAARTDRTVAVTGAVVGGGALAIAAYLWWRSSHPPASRAAATTARLWATPVPSLAGGSLDMGVRW